MTGSLEGQRSALEQGALALGLSPDAAQIDRLLAYGALILKWNKVYNLTALRDPAAVLTHHLLDSLAVVGPLMRERPGAGRLLDVGAGAGLPGVVIARPDDCSASRARFQSAGCFITAPNATSPSSTPCSPNFSTSAPSTSTDIPKLPRSA